MSLEMGCVFFSVLHYPGDQRQQIELSSRITHTEDAHGHPDRQNKGRRRTAELRHQRKRTQRDAQKKNMLSLTFLGDGNSLLLDCLDQEKEKESG